MPSRNVRRIRLALGFLLASVLSLSCGGGGGGGGGGFNDGFDRQALLTNIATTQAIPAYQDFVTKADALAVACDAYADEIVANGAGPAADTLRDAAKTAFEAAMLSWSACELFQFGPAGTNSVYKGGDDDRDEIYSWTFTNSCLIDTALASATVPLPFTQAGFFYGGVNVSGGGLAAVEYALYYDNAASTCTSSPAGFPTGAQLLERRALFAKAASEDVAARAQGLVDAWTGAGNFLAKFNNAAGSGVYSSAHEAVNQVFWSLFYFDLYCKDRKIAHPLGLNDPLNNLHPELVESRFAGTSIPQLKRNVQVFETAFLGAPAGTPSTMGFDDFLIARGADALATTLTTDIAAARVALDNITAASVTEALNDNPAGSRTLLLAAHAALKKVTDNLKSQFVTALNLSVPATGAGDND